VGEAKLSDTSLAIGERTELFVILANEICLLLLEEASGSSSELRVEIDFKQVV
jgi:hypothetical protein